MRVALVAMLVLLVGCTPDATANTTTSLVATTPAPDGTTAVTGDPGLGCPQNADFVGTGQVLRVDQPESDSARVGLITWEATPGCEVVQIDFETAEGAPATTPPSVDIEYLDSLQVLRIAVSANDTIITDQLVQTELVDRLFTIMSLDGEMFVDLHLRQPTQARARISTSPARVFIELQHGPGEFLGQAAVSDIAVLTDPWEGATVATNLEVTGYAMTLDDQVMIIATNSGTVALETATGTAVSSATWAEFKTRIDVPMGETSLFVGEQSEDEPGLAGVTVGISTG